MVTNSNKANSCVFQQPLSEQEISEILDDEGSSASHAHLELCVFCRERVEDARQAERLIRSSLHPSAMMLGSFQLGLVSEDKAIPVAQHLETCGRCRAHVASLVDFLADAEDTQEKATEEVRLPVSSTPHDKMPGVEWLVVREAMASQPVRVRGNDPEQVIMAQSDGVKLSMLWSKEQGLLTGTIMSNAAIDLHDALVFCYQGESVRVGQVNPMGQFFCKNLQLKATKLVIVAAQRTVAVLREVHLDD